MSESFAVRDSQVTEPWPVNHRVKGCMEILRYVLMGRGRVLLLHVYLLPQNVNVSVARRCCEPQGCEQYPKEGRVCHSRLPFLYC